MPLIHVYHPKKDRAYLNAISDGLHEALVETWKVPLNDRFQVFHEKELADLQIDKEMWDVDRSDDTIVFHIFTSPRTSDMKLALYDKLPFFLKEKAGLRPEDVFVSISSNTREDWSFGNGQAHLLLGPQGQTSPEVLAAPAPPQSSLGGGRRSLTTMAAARRSLSTSLAAAPMNMPMKLGGGGAPAVGKLGLIAACGASAFFGALASQGLGEKK